MRGLAADFCTLFVAIALFGFGGPVISIGIPKLVSVWFDGNERNLVAGVYASGPVVESTVALATTLGVVMPLLHSWRNVSVIYGMVVLFTGVSWSLLSHALRL